MKFVEDVMDMDIPDPDERTFGKVLQIKQQVAQSLFTTTARVRDGLLRPATNDGMDAVLAAVRQAQNDDRADAAIDIFS